MPPKRRREPHIAWPLKALAALGVGGAIFAGVNEVRGGDGAAPGGPDPQVGTTIDRTNSQRVGPGDPAWKFRVFPGSYEIVYRVAITGSESTERLRVSAPFDSRAESFPGTGVTGAPASEREFSFGVLATKSTAKSLTVVEVPPALAGPRPAVAVMDAEEEGLVERREVRRVAGRVCQVWRTSDEQAATVFLPPEPGQYIDVCVDRQGLVLEEWQVDQGRPVRQRVATSVRAGSIDRSELAQLPRETTLGVAQGGGSVKEIPVTEQAAGPFLELGPIPPGFVHRGRYTVVPPQRGLVEEGERGRTTAATSDVLVRGDDAIVIERGGVLDLSDPWTVDDRLPDVDLGPVIGSGELLAGTSGAEVRALLGEGRYLRIYGSADLQTLTALARSLIAIDNGSGIGFPE